MIKAYTEAFDLKAPGLLQIHPLTSALGGLMAFMGLFDGLDVDNDSNDALLRKGKVLAKMSSDNRARPVNLSQNPVEFLLLFILYLRALYGIPADGTGTGEPRMKVKSLGVSLASFLHVCNSLSRHPPASLFAD